MKKEKKLVLSASKADQWMHCTESLNPASDPLRKISQDEFIGNITHEIVEILSKNLELYRKILDESCENGDPIGLFEFLATNNELSIEEIHNLTNEHMNLILKDVKFYLDFSGAYDLDSLVVYTSIEQEKDFFDVLKSNFEKLKPSNKELNLLFVEIALKHEFKNGSLIGVIDSLLLEVQKTKDQLSIDITITDLKTGWIPVIAEESHQLKVYADLVINSLLRFSEKYP